MVPQNKIFRERLNYDSASETCRGSGVWPGDSGIVVNSFRYWRDGLFLVARTLYAVNRWIVEPRVHCPFLHNHFNDLLLIPCALPLLLFFHRRLGLRLHDCPPTPGKIALYLTVWSILFEDIGPHLLPRAVGNPWDVAAYVLGGAVAGLWWHRSLFRRCNLCHEL